MGDAAPQSVRGVATSPNIVHIYHVLPFFVPNPSFEGMKFSGKELVFREWARSSFQILRANEKEYCNNQNIELPSSIPKIAQIKTTDPGSWITSLLLAESGVGAYVIKGTSTGLENMQEEIKNIEKLRTGIPKRLNETFGSQYRKGEWQTLIVMKGTDKNVSFLKTVLAGRWRSLASEKIHKEVHFISGNSVVGYVMNKTAKKIQKIRILLLNACVQANACCLVTKNFGSIAPHLAEERDWLILMHWLNPWILAGYIGRRSPHWGMYLQLIRAIIERKDCSISFRGMLIGFITTQPLDEKILLLAKAAYTVPPDKRSNYVPIVLPPAQKRYNQTNKGDKIAQNDIIQALLRQADLYISGDAATSFMTVSKVCEEIGDRNRRRTQEVRALLEHLVDQGYLKKKQYTGSGRKDKTYQYSMRTIDDDRRKLITDYIIDLFKEG
ncbi:MAG: hypothetical protein D6732_06685 [Methanobacteriota archaeon]|nr:MAG: hypothetical protein D6732_06685 [Euryarchaeota archaeon]